MQHQRREHVELETTRHRISGFVTLAQNGFRSRISDMLNASEREFISLTEATIEPLEGEGPAVQRPFVAVSRAHIVFVTPLGDGADEAAA